jgi:hypothetical protein
MTATTENATPAEVSPASIVPLRQYKAHYKTEDEIKREIHKLGAKILEGARDIEGTKFAQLTVLAADYVELKMRETNDRESIKERDIRNFIKLSIGYGDDKGRVAASERSSTIEGLLGVSAMAAFLYHHGFNGCDIRSFVGTEPAKEGTKGAIPRLAMPFNQWLPRIQVLGSEVKRVDNPDSTYRPLPAWAIRAQYTLMVSQGKAEIDPNSGRIQRGTTERQSAFEKMNAVVDTALKSGQVSDDAVLAAASLLVTALRSKEHVISEKTEDAFVWLYELLDRRLNPEEEEVNNAPKRRKSRA